jgi:hypothetical protein
VGIGDMPRHLGGGVLVRASRRAASRGGYLVHMFWFNSVVLAATLLLALGVVTAARDRAVVFMSLYWIRVLHGLLSLPFLVFKLPLVMRIYVGATPTGYDERGSTVVCMAQQEVPQSGI